MQQPIFFRENEISPEYCVNKDIKNGEYSTWKYPRGMNKQSPSEIAAVSDLA